MQESVCGRWMGAGVNSEKDGTYLGVAAVIPRGRHAVLCTVCKFLSDRLVCVRGWEWSMASRSSEFGSFGP